MLVFNFIFGSVAKCYGCIPYRFFLYGFAALGLFVTALNQASRSLTSNHNMDYESLLPAPVLRWLRFWPGWWTCHLPFHYAWDDVRILKSHRLCRACMTTAAFLIVLSSTRWIAYGFLPSTSNTVTL